MRVESCSVFDVLYADVDSVVSVTALHAGSCRLRPWRQDVGTDRVAEKSLRRFGRGNAVISKLSRHADEGGLDLNRRAPPMEVAIAFNKLYGAFENEEVVRRLHETPLYFSFFAKDAEEYEDKKRQHAAFWSSTNENVLNLHTLSTYPMEREKKRIESGQLVALDVGSMNCQEGRIGKIVEEVQEEFGIKRSEWKGFKKYAERKTKEVLSWIYDAYGTVDPAKLYGYSRVAANDIQRITRYKGGIDDAFKAVKNFWKEFRIKEILITLNVPFSGKLSAEYLLTPIGKKGVQMEANEYFCNGAGAKKRMQKLVEINNYFLELMERIEL